MPASLYAESGKGVLHRSLKEATEALEKLKAEVGAALSCLWLPGTECCPGVLPPIRPPSARPRPRPRQYAFIWNCHYCCLSACRLQLRWPRAPCKRRSSARHMTTSALCAHCRRCYCLLLLDLLACFWAAPACAHRGLPCSAKLCSATGPVPQYCSPANHLQLEREQRGLRRELDRLKEQSEQCADQAKGYTAQLTELQAKASKQRGYRQPLLKSGAAGGGVRSPGHAPGGRAGYLPAC